MKTSNDLKTDAPVVDLASFRKKKETAVEFARGREPLYVSHLKGKVTGPKENGQNDADFGDRLQRIRSSLDKINRLMTDLKRMSSTPENVGDAKAESNKK